MKKVLAFIFLVVFSLQTFYTAGVIVWFFANQKILAQKHCVNKKRPELKCDGKCFLSKKIKEAEQREDKQEALQVKWVETSPCTISSFHFNIEVTEVQHTYSENGTAYYSFNFRRSIFHPPAIG